MTTDDKQDLLLDKYPPLDRTRLEIFSGIHEHIDWSMECWLCGAMQLHDGFTPAEDGWSGRLYPHEVIWLCPSCEMSNP
jgi:hypothetical protein